MYGDICFFKIKIKIKINIRKIDLRKNLRKHIELLSNIFNTKYGKLRHSFVSCFPTN